MWLTALRLAVPKEEEENLDRRQSRKSRRSPRSRREQGGRRDRRRHDGQGVQWVGATATAGPDDLEFCVLFARVCTKVVQT